MLRGLFASDGGKGSRKKFSHSLSSEELLEHMLRLLDSGESVATIAQRVDLNQEEVKRRIHASLKENASSNLREVLARLEQDRDFAELTVAKRGTNFRHYSRLSSGEQIVALRHARLLTEEPRRAPTESTREVEDSEPCRVGRTGETTYMEVDRPITDNALCSDDECPCDPFGVPIPRGQGFVYISKEVVEARLDCPTKAELERKLQGLSDALGAPIVIHANPGTYIPILMCEQGARQRGIDLRVAAEDAKHWWETGLVPLRPTPLASVERH